MLLEQYPKEHFVVIENEPDFLGRITINKINEKYCAEIDIVQEESRKIFKHVNILYDREDELDAIDSAMQVLARFLRNEK
jgi:hypothetical protein